MSFEQHCTNIGIQLLRDDIKFIKAQLSNIPLQLHRDVLSRYANTWLAAMDDCGNVIRKMNSGRFAANTKLREFTCKVQ